MKLFYLQRSEDASGVSGTGRVAEGVQFSDGTCVIRWLTKVKSQGSYASIDDIIHIHGHEGRTLVEFFDRQD